MVPFPKKALSNPAPARYGSDVDLLKSESSVLASQPQNDIRASFLNPSPKNCQKVVDELTDGKKDSLLLHLDRRPENLPPT